ncbi:hypothetical protein JCM24511_05807 [Saitozyma sp. JCM 24511]|nr:hypothetical protein JCM24511_05807 [Saitozyma sp. JCM 24511]
MSTTSAGAGVKRKANGVEPPNKKPAPHPFFTGALQTSSTGPGTGTFLPSPPSLMHYLHLDPFSTLPPNTINTTNDAPDAPPPSSPSSSFPSASNPSKSQPKPKSSPTPTPTPTKVPIVFYDLDGTLIKTRSGADFPKSRDDWTWWDPVVPGRLKKEWEEGKHVVVVSNQGDAREKIRREWRAKVPLIAAKMPKDVPLRVLAALDKYDVYRKPNIGMFEVITSLYAERGLEVDMDQSVFVGDAAGRMAGGGRKKDHGDTDYKFAFNVGLRFVTPEEHFLGHPRPSFPEPPNGFRPSKLANLSTRATVPPIVPSHTPIARSEVELVLFVGPPASGKTSFFRTHFAPAYEHVNQDLLGSRDKCLRAAEVLLRDNKSVVVDNTNRNRSTRSYWINLAHKLDIPIRVFHFLCPIELAKHNNMYRACYAPTHEPRRTLLPMMAFASFAADFEQPTLDEGFDELRSVNFHWEGDEQQRKKWDMYMLEPKR